MSDSITVYEFKTMQDNNEDYFLLDVRGPDEFAKANIGGHLIPMAQIPSRLEEIPKDKPVIILCLLGRRGKEIETLLRKEGYDARNLKGGLAEWAKEIDPSIKVG